MTDVITNTVFEVLPHIDGYVYPNEANLQPLWGVLIVLYPYITGLVAGAFIMASLLFALPFVVLVILVKLFLPPSPPAPPANPISADRASAPQPASAG
jgi:hypothetical protein